MAQQNTFVIDLRLWFNRILKNWYWFVISCFICGLLGIYKFFTTTPKYAVNARIMLRASGGESPLGQIDMMQMMGIGGQKQTEDEIAILTSRDILTQVVKDLDLQSRYYSKKGLRWVGQYPSRDLTIQYPEMFLDTTKRSVRISIRTRENGYKVCVKYGLFKRSFHKVDDITKPFNTCAGELWFTKHKDLKVGSKYYISTLPILPAVDMYNQQIVAETIKKESNIIEISTITDMPTLAIDFINREIELYNTDAVKDKNMIASNTVAFIDERLQLIERELADAEEEVEQYKEKYGIIDLQSEAGLYLTESVEYKQRVAEIETQINLVNYVAEFISKDSQSNMLIPANLGIIDASLITLIEEYNQLVIRKLRIQRTATDSSPVIAQMDAQLQILRDNIITSIDGVSQQLTISKGDLDKRYGALEKQRYDIPNQERQYIEVARKKALKESLYLLLYEKREENALTLVASNMMPAKIIAKPQMHPETLEPNLKMLAILSLFFGLGLPILGMYLFYLFNNKLTDNSQDLEQRTKIPFGGSIAKNSQGQHIVVKDGENTVSAELFRSLRTNIGFMLPREVKVPVILVTSSINGEGKSYVATNLAISLSLLNKKVALVGLDVRKPMLAEYLSLPNNGCLTNYLSDDSISINDLAVASNYPNLTVIPAGTVPPNPSELLQSDKLDALFAQLRQEYDYIIVDSSPVTLVSDTFLLNRLVDMTLYVCRAKQTTYNMIDTLNQINEQKRLNNIVTVLNGVNSDEFGYGYGYNSASNKR